MRKFFVPEVVQTSAMDCGPASLKCLLDGFGIPVSYGRLREACQTDIDGTSIDTMETVANQLGLEAEQIMLPLDHVLLEPAKALPAIAVVSLPNGLTHFVVLWRRHGTRVQIMDPAAGRRWVSRSQFENELYRHSIAVPAADWREFASSVEFQGSLEARLRHLGIGAKRAKAFLNGALACPNWKPLATLDAAVRLSSVLSASGGLRKGAESAKFLERVIGSPHLIPGRYWSAALAPTEDGIEHVRVAGAVLVRITGKKAAIVEDALGPELKAAIHDRTVKPGRELLRLLKHSNTRLSSLILPTVALASAGTLVEALLFRSLFDISTELGLPGQRMGAIGAVLLFSLALLLLEIPIFSTAVRLGRHMEARLRVAFLEKIPKLGDRYFQSRLTSDMAERSHATHRLRNLPVLVQQLLRACCELCVTSAGIVWLEPSSLPRVLLILLAAVLPSLITQPALAERDLRARNHAAGLTRFYLDAMLGLSAIRAHGAERSIRTEHAKLLGAWAEAALRLQRAVVASEAVQLLLTFSLVVALLLFRSHGAADMGRVLLAVYWTLNIPVLGQEIALLSRQYPYYRNLTLRLLDPLGAPSEQPNRAATARERSSDYFAAPHIAFHNVSVEISGHQILDDINLELEAATHVAIVGPSGAGKSSLVALLLGFLSPTQGDILIGGQPLNPEQLRRSTAWVDPAITLWNRSLHANLVYGSTSETASIGDVLDAAALRTVLEKLPDGLQTKLGEGGALVSGGEGQRVRFGRALSKRNARLVILDEPFRGLDREKRRELLSRARSEWRDCTLICVTHDIAETAQFDRILVVEQGRVIEDGHPSTLRVDSHSRYSQLLEAEDEIRSGLWSSGLWRRIRVQGGRIVEEPHLHTDDESEAYPEEKAS
ncbi:MAG: cysteine peptidase family C39 domain-containing protein [Bryobacteraceae bacterium]